MTTAKTTDPIAVPAVDRSCPFSPPTAYQQALRHAAITRVRLWDGSESWMATRHEDVCAILADPRFSSDTRRPGFPFLNPARKAVADGNRSFINLDGPDHTRLRRLVLPDFKRRNVDALHPEIRRTAEELVDAMTREGTAADLMAQFALPLPSRVICLLLGIPYQDRDYFQRRSRVLMHNDADPAQARQASDDLDRYLTGLVRDGRAAPGGIVSRLSAQDGVAPEQIAATGRLLLINGHESTSHMIALSVLVLLRNPGQLVRLRAEPALAATAVDELLRYVTILHHGLGRIATEDVPVDRHVIRAGEGVICMLSTANRDEAAFPAAADVDLTRDARHHVAFGFGAHRCLGELLAEAELAAALETLLRRLPRLRLAVPESDVPFRYDTQTYGVHALPVRWD
ncbi:cytochrome P450 [Kitasatospora sp. NPDC092039]|uniref:cytochrome P450 n=1 Tax=Kitasatospora sp. NPDC092039 TaxID=3364086 RepID=UPI003813B63F